MNPDGHYDPKLSTIILTIPFEIMSDIFLQCMPSYPARSPLSGEASPEKLGHICARWRKVAHNTPALWRAIDFASSSDVPCHNGRVTIAKRWLERSKTLPLSFHFSSDDFHSPDTATQAMEALLVHRHRWEHIMLRLDTMIPVDLYLGPCVEGPFSLLTHMDVNQATASETFMDLPSLTSMSLHELDFMDAFDHLPWGRLTSLFLNGVYPDTAAKLLLATPALVRCRLMLSVDNELDLQDPIPELPQVVQLPSLDILVFEIDEAEDRMVELIRVLSAPSLTRLYIHDDIMETAGQAGAEHLPVLAQLVASLGCKLEYLTVATKISVDDIRKTFPDIAHVGTVEYGPLLEDGQWGVWSDE
ncbi:F-box domain-containing protein [Mycena kentingensis (nom. inval.)]|nr:F-box domain-containing protein [Mycena kentingensis (nom. inval.)]